MTPLIPIVVMSLSLAFGIFVGKSIQNKENLTIASKTLDCKNGAEIETKHSEKDGSVMSAVFVCKKEIVVKQ